MVEWMKTVTEDQALSLLVLCPLWGFHPPAGGLLVGRSVRLLAPRQEDRAVLMVFPLLLSSLNRSKIFPRGPPTQSYFLPISLNQDMCPAQAARECGRADVQVSRTPGTHSKQKGTEGR